VAKAPQKNAFPDRKMFPEDVKIELQIKKTLIGLECGIVGSVDYGPG